VSAGKSALFEPWVKEAAFDVLDNNQGKAFAAFEVKEANPLLSGVDVITVMYAMEALAEEKTIILVGDNLLRRWKIKV
jgi:hypothetical protein